MSKLPRGLHCLSENCPISGQLMEPMSTCRLGIYFATSTLKPFITKLQNVNSPYWLLYIWHWLWEFDDSAKFCEKGKTTLLRKDFHSQTHVNVLITCVWQENNLFLYQIMSYINAHTIVCFILLTAINIITLDFYILLFVGSQTWITYISKPFTFHTYRSQVLFDHFQVVLPLVFMNIQTHSRQ